MQNKSVTNLSGFQIPEMKCYCLHNASPYIEGVHLTLPPDIFSVQVKSGACYLTGQWVASSE